MTPPIDILAIAAQRAWAAQDRLIAVVGMRTFWPIPSTAPGIGVWFEQETTEYASARIACQFAEDDLNAASKLALELAK